MAQAGEALDGLSGYVVGQSTAAPCEREPCPFHVRPPIGTGGRITASPPALEAGRCGFKSRPPDCMSRGRIRLLAWATVSTTAGRRRLERSPPSPPPRHV